MWFAKELVMRRLAFYLGLMIVVIAILGFAAPTVLLNAATSALTKAGLYTAAVTRVFFGLILILAAAASRLPRTIRTLGILMVVGGLVTPFIGVERARTVIEWWTMQGPLVIRAWAAIALVLGAFIIYAVTPRHSEG